MMTNPSHDAELAEALATLRAHVEVPDVDATRQRELLAAFDQHWARPASFSGGLTWAISTASLIVLAVALNWMVVSNPGQAHREPAADVVDLSGFVPWPGAAAWPPFESGALVRVNLPVSELPSLGLTPPPSAAPVVPADVIVGQDGFARAVRLAQQ
jgi:hypothetical protein